MNRVGLWIVMILILPHAVLAEYQYVQVAKTRLLSRPSAFSKAKAILPYRAKVEIIQQHQSYYQVKTERDVGYVPKRSLGTTKPEYASRLKGQYLSSDEVAIATKGFNAQVEAQHQKTYRDLPYAKLDKLMAETRYDDPMMTYQTFRQKGKLGEYHPKGGVE